MFTQFLFPKNEVKMATENGMGLNPHSLHEVFIRHIDEVGGCFLSDLGMVLGQRGLVFSRKEFNDTLSAAAKAGRFVLSF